MKADILKLLLQSHADGDESSFRKAALQLAATESTAGHVRVAEEIRAIIANMPATSARKSGPVVDIAAPRTCLRAATVTSVSATSCCVPTRRSFSCA